MTIATGKSQRWGWLRTLLVALSGAVLLAPLPCSAEPLTLDHFRREVPLHPGQTAVSVLEDGDRALLARAWLADHAHKSIEVQYFIWSSDNIGTLAAEALLRAAERGVRVRVIVDDLLIDAPDKLLLALAKHPNVEIRIYNPQHSVGTPAHARIVNMLTGFRGFNQRMHDKVFVVDGDIAIVGGRNMADEYFDYDHAYNFRDRDLLLLGEASHQIHASFERFWNHRLSVPAEELYDGLGLMRKHLSVDAAQIAAIYRQLHAYAGNPENFAPEVRRAIADIDAQLPALLASLSWCRAETINDLPGKNDNLIGLGGGSRTSARLAELLQAAQSRVTIQSPYLILSDEAFALFRSLRQRGIAIRISTNSLASTDNLPAFSGYRSQRNKLLAMGVEIFEYRPDAEKHRRRLQQLRNPAQMPILALHAKSVVVDGERAFVGTFNLDPRSQNLNTETGVILHQPQLARAVEQEIEQEMQPENSWRAGSDHPDSQVGWGKRMKVWLWQLLPMQSLL